jgi:hypothetical protein
MIGLPISATAAQTVQGTGTFGFVNAALISSWTADGNSFKVFTQTNSFTGLMMGKTLIKYTLVNHPAGPEEFFGTGTFTGNIQQIGTGTFNFAIQGSGPDPGVYSGHSTVLSGTGDFATLQGVIQFQNPPPIYSARFVTP